MRSIIDILEEQLSAHAASLLFRFHFSINASCRFLSYWSWPQSRRFTVVAEQLPLSHNALILIAIFSHAVAVK